MPELKGERIFRVELAFSPDGQQLACLRTDKDLSIWDWRKAKELHRVDAGGRKFGFYRGRSIDYAPDGKSLAMVERGLEQGTMVRVRLLDPATGNEINAIHAEAKLQYQFSLAFSPDSKILALAAVQNGTLVEAATSKELGKFGAAKLGSAATPAFSKDGSKLYLAGSFDNAPKVLEWDPGSSKVLRDCPASFVGKDMLLAPDGNTLVLAGQGPQFFALGGKEITAVNHPSSPLVSVKYLADGKTIMTGSGFPFGGLQGLQRWEALTGRNLGAVRFPTSLSAAIVSPDDKVLASLRLARAAKETCKVMLHEAASAKEIGQIALQEQEPSGRLCFSPDGKTLAISQPTKQKLELYDVATAKLLRTFDSALGAHQGLAFSADGKTLAWYGKGTPATLVLVNIATGMQIASLPLRPKAADSRIDKQLAFSPDGRCLALDMEDGTVLLYELATAELRCTVGKKASAAAFSCFAFCPDGKSLAQAGADGIIHVYDLLTGKELAAFKGHAEGVNAVAFAPDGQTLASASEDSTALIWDVSKIARPLPPAKGLTPADLENHWQSLAESDAAKAFDAIGALTAVPKDAVAFLMARVKPAAPLDLKRVQALIAQLDDDQFKMREKAVAELLKIGEQIVPALDQALAAQPPLETKRRLEDLRAKLTGLLLQGERLRAYRSVEVLELIGTLEARQVLQALADGAPEALLTTNAQAALKR